MNNCFDEILFWNIQKSSANYEACIISDGLNDEALQVTQKLKLSDFFL